MLLYKKLLLMTFGMTLVTNFWEKVLLVKVISVKECPSFYGTPWFITMITRPSGKQYTKLTPLLDAQLQ